jgi:hypothetical protein
MSPLLPASVGGSLPIPLEAAAHYLCRAACAGLLKIKGSKGGTEEPVMVPIAAGFLVLDLYEEREGYRWASIVDPASAIGQVNYNRRYTNYWKHLYVSAAECRACWPSATAPPALDFAAKPPVETVDAALEPMPPALAPQPPPLPAPAPPEKRGAGRKRALRSATIDYLQPLYPNGKPDSVSYDMIRAGMGKALQPSDKTIREAFKDMLQQAK